MKKSLLLVAAAVTALFSACSSDDLARNGAADGNTVNVSFSANFDQVMSTRSVAGESDGTAATKLYVAVYSADNELITAISHIGTEAGGRDFVPVSGKTATVNFQLVKGQTYNFVFWAQNPNATDGAVVFNPTTGKVAVDYSKITANDESLDAFTAHVNGLEVTGAISKNVELKRPWAQVNYGSAQADWNAAVAAGITVAKSKVTVNNVYTTLNALTGQVEGDATMAGIVLAANTIPASFTTPRTLTVGTTDYKYVGLNYLLVGNEGEQSLVKADLELQKADGEVINTIAFSNTPVQRNYRTNIVGNLLTSQTQFNITLDPMYEDDNLVEVWDGSIEEPDAPAADGIYHITNASELAWIAEQVAAGTTFAGKTVQLDTDIDLNGKPWTPIGSNADDAAHNFQGTFDGNGKTISNLNVDLTATPAYRSAGLFGAVSGNAVLKNFTVANATVKNITSGSATVNGTAVVAGSFTYGGGGTIENVTVKNSTVEGNRYVGGVAGYFGGTVKNCTVDGLIMTAKPDNLTGSYDNGDKVGGVVGYANSTTNTITNNTIKNFTITAYRDFGGILGCGNLTFTTVSSNTVTDGTLIIDQITNSYGVKTANANAVVGRVLGGSVDASNASSNVTIDENVANGISRANNIYTVTGTATTSSAIATIYTNAKNNGISDFTINLPVGNFVLPTIVQQNITIRIKGDGNNTKLTVSGASQAYFGCTVNFSDVTMVGDTNTDFTKNHGLYHIAKETYSNVTFTKFRFFYAPECTLNNCKFVQDAYDYTFCSYGTRTMTLNDCEMECVGKAAKIYGVDASNPAMVTFNRCKFTCDGSARQTAGKDWKTALEIDARAANNTHFTVNINNTVGCTGFYTSENTAIAKTDANYQGTLYNVDNGSGSKIVVNIDGVQQTQAW